MKIPQLPTDNLYKFFAILGMIIFVSGIIFLEFDKTNDIQFINRFLVWVTLAFGVIISIFGFIFWYHKTQKHLDKILKNDTEKYLNEENLRIRTIQFEKEYLIYEKLWNELNILIIEIGKLKSESDLIKKNNNSKDEVDELEIRKLLNNDHPFNKAIHNFNLKFNKYRPFIPEKIYSHAQKITEVSRKLFIKRIITPLEVQAGLKSNSKDIITQIENEINSLCNEIRLRIKITEKTYYEN